MRFTFEGSDFGDFLAINSLNATAVDQPDVEGQDKIKLLTTKGEITFQETMINQDLNILQSTIS